MDPISEPLVCPTCKKSACRGKMDYCEGPGAPQMKKTAEVSTLEERVAKVERLFLYLEGSLKECWKQERSAFENELARLRKKVEVLESYHYGS